MARSAGLLLLVAGLAATGCQSLREGSAEQLERLGAPFGPALPELVFDRPIDLIPPDGLHVASNEGREIVLGPRTGDYYIVRSGLREGERVVTNGNFKIDSALQILAKPSMMSPEGGGGGHHDHGGHGGSGGER